MIFGYSGMMGMGKLLMQGEKYLQYIVSLLDRIFSDMGLKSKQLSQWKNKSSY